MVSSPRQGRRSVVASLLTVALALGPAWWLAPAASAAAPPTAEELLAAPEFSTLLTIGAEITSRAVALDARERAQLTSAIAANDLAAEAALLGLGLEELQGLAGQLQEAAAGLVRRFPALEDTVAAMSAPCGNLLAAGPCDPALLTSDPEGIAQMWTELGDAVALVTSGGNLPPRPGCDWIQFTAALVICAVGSGGNPIVHVICAYVAYCSFCWGPVHDAICR